MFSSSIGLPGASEDRRIESVAILANARLAPRRELNAPFPMLKFLKIFFGIVIAGLVAVVALLYAFRDKITDAVQARVKSDLADGGVFVDWTLEPISFGSDLVLKFREIKTFQDSKLKEVGAELSNLDVHVHLIPTLTKKKPHATLLTKDAQLTIFDLEPKRSEDDEAAADVAPPTPAGAAPSAGAGEVASAPVPSAEPKKAEPIAVKEVNINAKIDDTHVRLSPSGLVFQGIRFSASGESDLPRIVSKHKPIIKTVEVKDAEAEAEPSTLDFSALVPVAEMLDYRSAGFTPEVTVRYTVTRDRDGAWTIHGQGNTKSFPSRGKDLAIKTEVLVRHDASGEVRSLQIKDGEFAAEGIAAINPGVASINITSLESTLDWIGILRDFPAMDHALDAFKVTANPEIELAGLVSFEEPKASSMTGSIRKLDGTYTPAPAPGGKANAQVTPLVIKNVEAGVQISTGVVAFKDGFGSLAGGPVRFEVRLLPFESKSMPWSVRFDGENLSLAQLTSAFAETKVEGTAALSVVVDGDNKPADLNGHGSFQVTATQPLKIPVVGPLLDLLATVIPNLFKSESDRLETSFTIKNGLVSTEDLSVGLSAVQVKATGTINLPTEETKFEANANLRGSLQKIAPNLPSVLAIEGGGPLKKVNWRFKNFQLGNGLADLLRGGGKTPPAAPDAAGQVTPTSGGGQPSASGLPGKAEELIRTVDQIGGLIKGLKGAANPPAPAPTTPPPAPVPAPPANP